jgi:hypothetical protein
VNGDDALILAKPAKISKYAKALTSIRLLRNDDKSFQSKPFSRKNPVGHGVFCERLAVGVYKNGRVRVTAAAEVRIGEASGVRKLEENKGFRSVDVLNNLPPNTLPQIRGLARRTANKIALLGHGKLSQGGGGRGRADAVSFRVMATSGPTRLPERAPTLREEKDRIEASTYKAALLTNSTGQPRLLQEVMAEFQTLQGQHRIIDGCFAGGAKKFSRGQLKSRYLSQVGKALKLSPLQALDSEFAKQKYSSDARRRARNYVRQKNYPRACNTLANDNPVVFAGTYVPQRVPLVTLNQPLDPRKNQVGMEPRQLC